MSVQVDQLVKSFGSLRVVDALTFAAVDGRVTGFLGRNGAGKSTTLRCLTGLMHPDAGTATVDGMPFAALTAPARRAGVALNPDAHHPDRTGAEHLRMLATAARLPRRRVDDVLALVELDDAAGRRAGTYSLGMRQRLHLAAALLGDPATLILDEPANGLDPPGIRWLRDLLRTLAAEGRCVLLSSHQLSEVAQTVDDVVVLAGGRLVGAGSLTTVLGTESVQRVRTPDPDRLAALLRQADARVDTDGTVLRVRHRTTEQIARTALDNGLLVTELATEEPAFEQRFFDLTEPRP